ncbi:MAG: helix-turn-helix domain-containing protein [Clostridia bacterium]|nr:helix-turn-helix domain-containing protein [Clostridia bacterium]
MNFIKFDPDDSFYFHKGISKRVSETGTSWPHYHSLFEIYFMLEGSCTYFIDNKVYNVQAGDIVIIPGGTIHHTKYENIRHSRVLLNCTEKYIPSVFSQELTEDNYLYRSHFLSEEAKKIFEKIEAEYKLNDNLSDGILICQTHALFYLLMRNKDSCITIDDGNSVIEKAVVYIRENFRSDISLSLLAKEFSVSPEHFSRSFKKETGLGFSKYLNSLRLQYAEQLLRSDAAQNITQIAERCGFEDSNYFSKKFKEIYGVSPKRMQKSIK